MENQESATAPALFRTRLRDEKSGLMRLVWAVEGFCPGCRREMLHVYSGAGKPDRAEVLMVLISPCPECALLLDVANPSHSRTKPETSRARKKERGDN